MFTPRSTRTRASHAFAFFVILPVIIWMLAMDPALGGPSGLDAPQAVGAYFNGVFPSSPPGNPTGFATENAFPNLTFVDPLCLQEIPGTNQLLVAGKTGLIHRFVNSPATTQAQRVLVLDWTQHTETSEDQGFYSVTFHPNFGQSGAIGQNYIYVCYSRRAILGLDDNERTYWTVSRFTWLPASQTLDPTSESILISQYDPHRFHNGGAAFFGDDGFFYVTHGDGGDSGDSFKNSQKIDRGLFSGILRIDVNNDPAKSHAIRRQPTDDPLWVNARPADWPVSFSQGYGIPNDNPWLDTGGAILEEFYAIGLRSPHSAHFDPVTDEIWVGDVGQNNREELTRVTKGQNCQWVYKEGTRELRPAPIPLIGTENPPVYDYPHTEGQSIIAGMRYRGAKWNAFLAGKVIFGDHVRGRIWTMGFTGSGQPDIIEIVSGFNVGYKAGLANFFTDTAGEIYIMNLAGNGNSSGTIHKLAVPALAADPPRFLSQTGVFSSLATLTPSSGVLPYNVQNSLWSDGAEKKRWAILPNDGLFDSVSEDVIFDEESDWVFPAGSVFVKHFEVAIDAANPALMKRLETRFVVCIGNGKKYGVTYKWNEAGTDAELLDGGLNEAYTYTQSSGATEQRTWSYPSRGDCLACHNDTSGQALGFKTHHLNGNAFYPATGRTANQLDTLNALGVFNITLTAQQLGNFIASRALDDETAPLEHRVRSYLDMNCSHCHQPGGQGAGFDARLGTPLDVQNLIDATPDRYEELGAEGRYIKPGDPALSAVHHRMSAVGNGNAMPPLAKNLAHGAGIAALQSYITGLQPAEFHTQTAPLARFVRLRSLSGTRAYASVAEFSILDGEGVEMSPAELSIKEFDSENGSTTAAKKAIDGIKDSGGNHWQTPNPASPAIIPPHPHFITVDLGSLREFGGYKYYPRTSSNQGRIINYEIHYSSDNVNWTLFKSGAWPTNTTDAQIYSPPYSKRATRAQIAGPTTSTPGGFEATIVFDMDVTDFTASDIQVTGGNVASIRGSGYYWVAKIQPTSAAVSVKVPLNVVSPEGQGSFPSTLLNVEVIDPIPPLAQFTGVPEQVAGPFQIGLGFGETVTGLAANDFTLSNVNLVSIVADGANYLLNFSPVALGAISIDLKAGAVSDIIGNVSQGITNASTVYNLPPVAQFSGAPSQVAGPFQIGIGFGEAVSGLAAADFTLTNVNLDSIVSNGDDYILNLTPIAEGQVSIQIGAGTVSDVHGSVSLGSPAASVNYNKPPVAQFSMVPAQVSGAFDVSLSFGEPVSGLAAADFSLINVNLLSIAPDGNNYILHFMPLADGAISIDLLTGAVTDSNGNSNPESPAIESTYNRPPVALFSGVPAQAAGTFQIGLGFGEPVTGLTSGDFTLTNVILDSIAADEENYVLTLTPVAEGPMTVAIGPGAASDLSGTPSQGSTSATTLHNLRPTAQFGSPGPVLSGTFGVTITFSESVTGLEAGDVQITGGTVASVLGSGTSYTVSVSPASPTVTLALPENTVIDSGNAGNLASSSLQVTPRTPYEQWAFEKQIDSTPESRLDDDDNDTIPAILEFAFGLDPSTSDWHADNPLISPPSGMPAMITEDNGGEMRMKLRYLRRKNVPGLIYVPHFGSSLDDFGPATASPEPVESLGTEWERVTVPDENPGGSTKRFGRVSVTLTE